MRFLSLIFLLTLSLQVLAVETVHNIGKPIELVQEINELFVDTNGEFSEEKISNYKTNILSRYNEVVRNMQNYKSLHEGESRADIREDISEEDILTAYNLIQTKLNEIKLQRSLEDKYQLAYEVLELEWATRLYGQDDKIVKIFKAVRELIKQQKVYKYKVNSGEAYNLFNPDTKTYYTQDELHQLKENGFDISKLDPSAKSHFWENRKIEDIDVKDDADLGTSLYDQVSLDFPNEAVFKSMIQTQTKPKFRLKAKVYNPYTGEYEKRNMKLKVASELQSEVTAGFLARVLGYHGDASKYVRDFVIKLDKDTTLAELKRDWAEYFKTYTFEDYVKEVYVDGEGITCIKIVDGILEAKPSELIRVGPWAHGKHGHNNMRETRALYIFNAWINNLDVKEQDNNKLILKKDNEGQLKIYQFQHDIGFSFGNKLNAKPQDYKWKIIKKITPNKIVLDYPHGTYNTGFEEVTWADARWIIRKIAKITRKQYEDIIEMSGWPEEVGLLLVEKLISRRNDLVSAFELDDEIELMPFNRRVDSENGILENGWLNQTSFEGFTQEFGNEFKNLFAKNGPAWVVLTGIEKLAISAAIKFAGMVGKVTFDGSLFGFNKAIVSEIELDIDRQISDNPNPKGLDDAYLVQDTFRIKYSLGAGIVLRGFASYYKEYKMIYTAPSYEEAMYKNNFIVNALLPRSIRKLQVPENYIILLEDGVEGEGEFLVGADNAGVSASIGAAVGKMGRTIVVKRKDNYSVLKDASIYNYHFQRIYAEFVILRIPMLSHEIENGRLYRNIYNVDLTHGDKDNKLDALESLLQTNNLSLLEPYADKSQLQDSYVERRFDFSFFGLLSFDNISRTDDIRYTDLNADGSTHEAKILQIDVEKEKTVSNLFGGETRRKSFRFVGVFDENNKIPDPVLDIKLEIEDPFTKTDEISDHYIPLINKLALSDDFIVFTPENFTANDKWGVNEITMRLIYDANALNKILNTSEDEFYEVMAKFSNRDATFWRSKRNEDYLSHHVKTLRRKYRSLVQKVSKARKQRHDGEKYKILINAIMDAIDYGEGGFTTLILQRINYIVGTKNYYYQAIIDMPEEEELRYPAKTPFYNVMNPELREQQNFVEIEFRDLADVWEAFY